MSELLPPFGKLLVMTTGLAITAGSLFAELSQAGRASSPVDSGPGVTTSNHLAGSDPVSVRCPGLAPYLSSSASVDQGRRMLLASCLGKSTSRPAKTSEQVYPPSKSSSRLRPSAFEISGDLCSYRRTVDKCMRHLPTSAQSPSHSQSAAGSSGPVHLSNCRR